MKSRVGIVTVHKNTNYGANLQAFASCAYLNKMGYDACIVDYSIPSHERMAHLGSWLKVSWDAEPNKSPKRALKLGAALLLSAGWKGRRLHRFNAFRKKHTTLSRGCKSIADIAALSLDAIVCGSDQIWNPVITEGINPIFFGDIPGVKTRISYAASIGKSGFSEDEERVAVPLIKALDYCSVREEQTAEYVRKISDREVDVVCDPVFLLDREDFDRVSSKRKIKGDYVLLYSIIQDDGMTAAALAYAERHGLPLVEICQSRTRGCRHKQLPDLGPAEFLSAFKYADTVFTNSFHGTAFSLIFEKNFYVFDNKHGGSRITNLLSKAGVGERIINKPVEADFDSISYSEVKKRMDAYAQASKEFLSRALSAEKKPVVLDGCVGCGACGVVCPRDAIRLVSDKEGFDVAYIDMQKCIGCGLCERTCPAASQPQKNGAAEDVFAFKAREEVRLGSTSGGAFAALAEAIVKLGGVFYGARLYDCGRVEHVRGDKPEDIALMQGTKYVPSATSRAFWEVIDDLKCGTAVLFSGTPCQIDALNKLVRTKGIDSSKLYTVDIICHGVPSQRVYEDYRRWLDGKLSARVVDYKFRYKPISWRGNSVYARLEDGSELKNDRLVGAFMNLYYSGNITRESCYGCKYTSRERVADITISDFWGIENTVPSFEDALGVSMVMINTERGRALFDVAEGERIAADVSAAKQPQLKAPAQKPETRELFWKTYGEKGIHSVLREFGGICPPSIKTRIYNKLKRKK